MIVDLNHSLRLGLHINDMLSEIWKCVEWWLLLMFTTFQGESITLLESIWGRCSLCSNSSVFPFAILIVCVCVHITNIFDQRSTIFYANSQNYKNGVKFYLLTIGGKVTKEPIEPACLEQTLIIITWYVYCVDMTRTIFMCNNFFHLKLWSYSW